MIDIKAKAKPLYVILVALVLVSTATIIAGTTTDKSIELVLEYASDSKFDRNNDGITGLKGAIDFSVSETEFNWDLNEEDLLCTKWDIFSQENDTSTIICHGAKACCNAMGLEPYQPGWNDDLVLTYGRFDSTENNIVYAQVILLEEKPVYSNEESLTAVFDPSEDKKIRNKKGDKVGEYDVTERGDGKYDIRMKPKPKKGTLAVTSSSEWDVVIAGANLPEINSKIDTINDNRITTQVIAVDEVNIEEAQITLEKQGNVDVILRCENFDVETFECSEWVETDIEFVDNGDTITFTVTHFSGYAGGQINVINVQSYPLVTGNWTVRFTTNGTANLTITPFNGTLFGVDLDFLELRCGDNVLSADYDGTRVFYEDYNCAEEGSEISQVLTEGKHSLMFEFGNSVAYAYNNASNIIASVTPNLVNFSDSVTFNVYWDPNTENMRMMICRTATCNGCWWAPAGVNETWNCFCHDATVSGTPAKTCTYQTKQSDPSNNTYWVRLYNDSEYGDDPSDGVIKQGSTAFQVNHRPVAFATYISPFTPNASSTLYCNYTYSDSDDDSMLMANFTWWVRNESVGPWILNGTSSQKFVDGFDANDKVKCGVRVWDEHGLYSTDDENSSAITILNTPPTQPTVSVSPYSPGVYQNIYCNVTVNSTDPDGDSITYTYRWINGSNVMRTFGPTTQIYDYLGGGNTSFGETWLCNVTPNDGAVDGVSGTDSVTVTNMYPQALNVNVTSTDSRNLTNGTLTGAWTFYDPNPGDPQADYETKWYLNGNESLGLANQTQISSSNTIKGQLWKFSVKVFDGIYWSNYTNATITIENHIPEHTSPVLNTSAGNYNSTSVNLTAHAQNVVDVDNDDVKRRYKWLRNSRSYPATPIDVGYNDVVLKMPFENYVQSSDTYKDYSGYGNDGTVTNAVWNPTGGYDGFGAYEFDGVDDHINTQLMNLTSFTYSAWVKVDSFVGTHNVVLGTDNWIVTLYVYNSSTYPSGAWFDVWAAPTLPPNSEVGANNVIQLGQWHHLAGTFDGNYLNLYVDGNLVDCHLDDDVESTTNCTRFNTSIPMYDDFNLTIGANEDLAHDFNGTIDEVMIFNRSLSAAQIKVLYEGRTDIIVSDETNNLETWQVNVTLSDGEAESSTLASNSLYITNMVPLLDDVVLNSTLGLNSSGENLTCNPIGLSDVDGDDLKQIINWYMNGTSILALNMPFEGGSTSSWTKDYSQYGNNGTVNGSTWSSTSGYDGFGAYTFDGINDTIKVADDASLNFTDEVTVMAWINGKSNNFTAVNRTTSALSKTMPQLQVAGDKIYYAWHQDDGASNYDIWTASVNTDGTGWTETQRTSSDGYYPQLQVAGDKIHHVWSDWDGVDYQIYTAVMNTDGTGWTPTRRTTSAYDKWQPQLQVAGDKIYYIWYEYDGATYQIWTASVNTDGTGWSAVNRTNSSYGKWEPQLQVAGDKIYYTWYESDGAYYQIWTASVNTDGTGFSALNRTSSSYNKFRPQLQVAGDKIYYTWTENDGANQQIWTAEMYTNGTGWTATKRTTSAFDKKTPQLQVAGDKIYYTWYESDGTYDQIWTAEMYTNGTGWTPTQKTTGIYEKRYPQFQIVGSKTYYALNFDTLHYEIWTADSGSNIVNKGDSYGIGVKNNKVSAFANAGIDKVKYFANSTEKTNGKLIETDLSTGWNHVAMTYDKSELKLYLNGALAENASFAEDMNANPFKLIIGDDFNGTVDDVMVFNRALSAEQINAIYQNETNTLMSQETEQRERWQCEITANDRIVDGPAVMSNNITLKSSPFINTSRIPKFVGYNLNTINFSLKGENDIRDYTLLLEVNNGTNSTYHYLRNSIYYITQPWTFGDEIDCVGSGKEYDCTLTTNMSEGRYTLTFSVMDDAGDTGYAYVYDYIVDTSPPRILQVFEGYYDGAIHLGEHANVNTLYANWSFEPDNLSGIAYFEYAVGTGATYLSPGWNDTVGWTTTNLSNFVFVTLDMVHNERYYFHVRAMNNASRISNVTSGDGIFYEDDTPPSCPGWNPGTGGGCIHDDGLWTNSPSSLHAYWNFTDNGSDILFYKYAVGTEKYPNTGWDNTRAEEELSNITEVWPSGLSLAYNTTYYFNVKARNENPAGWSSYKYSDGIIMDNVKPYGGSISYTKLNITANKTTVVLDPGTDDLSGIGSAVLQQARTQIDPTTHACNGFSEYYIINASNELTTPISTLVSVEHGYCYKFKYIVYDNAGNSQDYYYSNEIYFYVDTTPPNINVTIQATDGVIFEPILRINWSANDPETGITYYSYFVNDSDGTVIAHWTNTTSTQVIISNDSIHHLRSIRAYVRAFNGAGLSKLGTSNSVLYKDDIPPDALVPIRLDADFNGSDASGWWDNVNNGATNLTLLANETGLRCYYSDFDMDYVDMEAFGTRCAATGTRNVTCNMSLGEGIYTYHVGCKDDNLGQQTASQNTDINFTVDLYAPTVTITAPTNGLNIGTGMTLNLTANVVDSGLGIEEVWYKVQAYSTAEVVDSDVISVNDNTYTLNTTWAITSLPRKGTYIFVVYANDTFGQIGADYILMYADNTEPTISSVWLNATTNGNSTYDNLTLYVTNATDADSDPVKSIINWYAEEAALTVLNMPFEGNSTSGIMLVNGSTKDYSGYGNDAVVYGAVWDENAGYDGKGAYSFDGVDDFIQLANISLEDKTLELRTWTGAGWMHIVNASGTIYVNGVTGSTAIPYSNNRLGPYGDGTYFSGVIDEVRIWNRTLSADYVKALYNGIDEVIVSQETGKDEKWYAGVTPNDGVEDGMVYWSNNLSIPPNRLPTMLSVILNSTSGYNYTYDNLTVYALNVTDLDNDDVKLIINWFKNNKSLAVLNMPFEGIPTRDYTKYANHGEANGALWSSTAGHDGKGAYVFDGNGFVNMSDSDSLNLTGSITISVWAKSDTATYANGGYLVAKDSIPLLDRSYAMKWGSQTQPGRARFTITTDIATYNLDSTSNLAADTWYHLVGTWNSATNISYLYINGELDNSATWNGTAIDVTDLPIVIGSDSTYNSSVSFDGVIDDVVIYNTTLTSAQVKALYTTNSLIVSDETTRGDTWQAEVVPNDGDAYGLSYYSNNLTIPPNYAPTVNSIMLNATSAGNWTYDNLTCYANISDVNGDSINLTGGWYLEGVLSPVELWEEVYDSGNKDRAEDVEVDSSGNVYVTGFNTSGGKADIITLKYDSNGNELWRVDRNLAEYESAYGIALDSSDNVYITAINGSVDFDFLTIKYLPNGTELWSAYYDLSSQDYTSDLIVDSSGDLYVTGCNGSGGVYDFTLIKYNSSNGNRIWTRIYEPGSCAWDIALDSSDNIYIAGNNLTGSTSDALLLKYNSSGHLLWNTTFDLSSSDSWTGITLDSSDNVYVSGQNYTGGRDFIIARYDSNGNQVWNRTHDLAGADFPYGIEIDSSDSKIYVAGSSNTGQDISIVKYNSSGDLIWSKLYDSGVGGEQALGMALDSSDDIYITGEQANDFITIKFKDGFEYNNVPYNSLVAVGTLDSASTSKGDNWSCSVTAYDGLLYSSLALSNNVTISLLNNPPYFLHALTSQVAYTGVEFIYDINATDNDPGETVTYEDNATQFVINETTGLINWSTPSVRETFLVNISVCDDSGASNNCTYEAFTITVGSMNTIEQSTINGIYYPYNVTGVAGIVGSVINLSTVAGPTISITDSRIYNSNITNSTLMRCNVSDSNVNDTYCIDSVIDPSILINSTIIDSIIHNSTIIDSTINNSNITNSTILSSIVFNAKIIDGVMYSGNLTFNGSLYDAGAGGAKNLTDLINYAPTAVIEANPLSGTSSVLVTFDATNSTDPNIPGDLSDTLTYGWDFDSNGTIDNTSSIVNHTYSGVGTYTATLTVTDKYGETSTANQTIKVNSPAPTYTSSGGGGGGGGSSYTTIDFTPNGTYFQLRTSDAVVFTYDNTAYTVRLTYLGANYAMLSIPALNTAITINLGESTKMDLNRNGVYDFYMALDAVMYGYGYFLIKSISEELPTPLAPAVQEPVPREEVEGETFIPPPQPVRRAPPTPVAEFEPPPEKSPITDWLIKLAPIALVAAVLAGLVLHKRAGVVVPEEVSAVERYVTSAFAKGRQLHDIHRELLTKGWPEESVYAAELKHLIQHASKKSRMKISDIQNELINKGWPQDIVKSSIISHVIRDHLARGKTIDHAKEHLKKHGWQEHEIHKHMKKAM